MTRRSLGVSGTFPGVSGCRGGRETEREPGSDRDGGGPTPDTDGDGRGGAGRQE